MTSLRFIVLSIIFISKVALSMSEIKLVKPSGAKFSRNSHAEQVLRLALDKTIQNYGPYKIKYTIEMTRDRAMSELLAGTIHVYDAPARADWEDKLLSVNFPVSKGLLSYRLLLIRKEDQKKFSKVESYQELMKLRAGLGAQWSTTKVLRAQDFKVVTGIVYEGLFSMLAEDRFDYFLRGANEIFGEMSNIQFSHPGLGIEKDLIVYIYQPIYHFVSPKYPLLAKRVKEGMRICIEDGSFEKLFLKNHGENLKKVKFNSRRLILIPNPLLKRNQEYLGEKYWFTPALKK